MSEEVRRGMMEKARAISQAISKKALDTFKMGSTMEACPDGSSVARSVKSSPTVVKDASQPKEAGVQKVTQNLGTGTSTSGSFFGFPD